MCSVKQMTPDERDEWDLFLDGSWTAKAPTAPGRYNIATRGGLYSGNNFLAVQADNGLIFVKDGRQSTNASVIWGGSFWNVPEPDMPQAPIMPSCTGKKRQ